MQLSREDNFSLKQFNISFDENYVENKVLIIPKHKEISRGTLNNIFKIISSHTNKNKSDIESEFVKLLKK